MSSYCPRSSLPGTVVSFDVAATDNADPNPQVTCAPASGSTFPIGETAVTCTATDSNGNTASATFKVIVLRPLDIGVQVDKFGSVNSSTGVATVRGTVSCNRPTAIGINGELQQSIDGRVVASGFSIQADCAPPTSTWTAPVTAVGGRYRVGPADATVGAGACDQFSSCDFDSKTRKIILRAK